jgi:hypothetical protein
MFMHRRDREPGGGQLRRARQRHLRRSMTVNLSFSLCRRHVFALLLKEVSN